MSDDEPLIGVGQAPYTEHFQGHTIECRKLDGARPWGVFVDGSLVYGNGSRVRRRLAYSACGDAGAAGRKHVRELDAATCARIGTRASDLGLGGGDISSATYARMVSSVHTRVVPLRLTELLDAANVDFAHDVAGILVHLSDELGAPTLNGFRPKFSVRGVPAR